MLESCSELELDREQIGCKIKSTVKQKSEGRSRPPLFLRDWTWPRQLATLLLTNWQERDVTLLPSLRRIFCISTEQYSLAHLFSSNSSTRLWSIRLGRRRRGRGRSHLVLFSSSTCYSQSYYRTSIHPPRRRLERSSHCQLQLQLQLGLVLPEPPSSAIASNSRWIRF